LCQGDVSESPPQPFGKAQTLSNNKQTNAKSPKPVKVSAGFAIVLTKATTCSSDKGRG
jgi:hypothetical protein